MEKKKRKKSIRSLIRSSIWILNKNSYKYYYCHQELLITKEDEYVFHYLEDVVANHYIKTIKNIKDKESALFQLNVLLDIEKKENPPYIEAHKVEAIEHFNRLKAKFIRQAKII